MQVVAKSEIKEGSLIKKSFSIYCSDSEYVLLTRCMLHIAVPFPDEFKELEAARLFLLKGLPDTIINRVSVIASDLSKAL